MPRNMLLVLLWFLVSTISHASDATSSISTKRPRFTHAYYLFLSGTPVSCEDCYVPLLIATESLEEIAREKTKAECALITTYERDSVWHNEGLVAVEPTEIEKSPRILHVRGKRYRYQEISAAEALKLLRNPMGTIPISRPQLPRGSPGPSIEALILELRNAN